MRMSIEEADELSKKLAERAREYNPECVISIRNGGYRVGEVVANFLEVPHYSIKVSKWCSGFVHNSLVQYMCNQLPLIGGLCKYMAKSIHTLSPAKLEEGFDDTICLDIRILLVDDATTTGKSIRTASKYLESSGLRNVRTSTLVKRGRFSPDYWITSKLELPWEI